VAQNEKRVVICPIFSFEIKEGNEQEFQISDNILLRRIKKDELEKMKKLPYSYMLGECLTLLNSQTFVFEINKPYFDEASRLAYEALLAMRLYKDGSVFCKNFWIEEGSKIEQIFTINPPIPWIKRNYILNIEEIDEIKRLLKKITMIELTKNKSYRVACERYSRSFEERRDDDRIIDLAIAFEALFTDEKTSASNVMGEFVGLGCSMLLGTNMAERNEIKEFLKKAFNIRNKITHGSEVKTPIIINKEKYEISDIALKLREYLGASIRKLI
jgi:hypothetical protein